MFNIQASFHIDRDPNLNICIRQAESSPAFDTREPHQCSRKNLTFKLTQTTTVLCFETNNQHKLLLVYFYYVHYTYITFLPYIVLLKPSDTMTWPWSSPPPTAPSPPILPCSACRRDKRRMIIGFFKDLSTQNVKIKIIKY